MNRTIKFRGLLTYRKEWVYGFPYSSRYNEDIDQIVEGDCHYDVFPETVGQFTGLYDKNGVEIYEGDICSGHSDGNGVITWTDFDGGYDYIFDDEGNIGIWEVMKDIIVIGNIHEKTETK